MSSTQIRHAIKSIVHGFLPDAEVLLFGSRARGGMPTVIMIC